MFNIPKYTNLYKSESLTYLIWNFIKDDSTTNEDYDQLILAACKFINTDVENIATGVIKYYSQEMWVYLLPPELIKQKTRGNLTSSNDPNTEFTSLLF